MIRNCIGLMVAQTYALHGVDTNRDF